MRLLACDRLLTHHLSVIKQRCFDQVGAIKMLTRYTRARCKLHGFLIELHVCRVLVCDLPGVQGTACS